MNTQYTDQNDNLMHHVLSNRDRFFIGSVLILLLFIITNAASADEGKSGLIRTPILENVVDLPSKNINAKVIRVTFPPHYKTPWHTHEGPGPRYVVKGKFEVTDNGTVKSFSNGEVFWETGKQMAIQNMSDETAELIIFELAPQH
jgi:quercetin dioxygenase-like cupin family protein